MKPVISRIRIYPVKSLDPIEISHAEIGIHSLLHDREFAMVAQDGRFVNGKRIGRVSELKATFDLVQYVVSLTDRNEGRSETFHLIKDKEKLEQFLTGFFGMEISLVRNTEGELMDIPTISSMTMLSTASLESLHSDLPSHGVDDLRLRFRPTLELSGVGPYWEEGLIEQPGTGTEIVIGDVKAIVVSPRARCNVPPRDPKTGITDKSFIKSMMKSRERTLPAGSKLLQHGNLYQLTVNVYVPQSEKGKIIRVGDEVKVIGTVEIETN